MQKHRLRSYKSWSKGRVCHPVARRRWTRRQTSEPSCITCKMGMTLLL